MAKITVSHVTFARTFLVANMVSSKNSRTQKCDKFFVLQCCIEDEFSSVLNFCPYFCILLLLCSYSCEIPIDNLSTLTKLLLCRFRFISVMRGRYMGSRIVEFLTKGYQFTMEMAKSFIVGKRNDLSPY